jgi:hypothetical protein
MAPRIHEINEFEKKNENDNLIMDLTLELTRFLQMYEQGSEDDGIFVYPYVPMHLNLQNLALRNTDDTDVSTSEYDSDDEYDVDDEDGFFKMDADVQDRALRNIPDSDEYESDDEYKSNIEDEDQYSKINPSVQDELVRNVQEY